MALIPFRIPRVFRAVVPSLRVISRHLRQVARSNWSDESRRAIEAELAKIENLLFSTRPGLVEVAAFFVVQFGQSFNQGVLGLIQLRLETANANVKAGGITLDRETLSETCTDPAFDRSLELAIAPVKEGLERQGQGIVLGLVLLDARFAKYSGREISFLSGGCAGASIRLGVEALVEGASRCRRAWLRNNIVCATLVDAEGSLETVEHSQAKLVARACSAGYVHCEVIWARGQNLGLASNDSLSSPWSRFRWLSWPRWRTSFLFASSYSQLTSLIRLACVRPWLWALAALLLVYFSWPAARVEIGDADLRYREQRPEGSAQSSYDLLAPGPVSAELTDEIVVKPSASPDGQNGLGLLCLSVIAFPLGSKRTPFPLDRLRIDCSPSLLVQGVGRPARPLRFRLADVVHRSQGETQVELLTAIETLERGARLNEDAVASAAIEAVRHRVPGWGRQPTGRRIALAMFIEHRLCPLDWELCEPARSRTLVKEIWLK